MPVLPAHSLSIDIPPSAVTHVAIATSDEHIASSKKPSPLAHVLSLARRSRDTSRSDEESLKASGSTLKLTKLNRMGTASLLSSERDSKILQMARGARQQLEPFANSQRPRFSGSLVHAMFMCAQPLMRMLLPSSCTGFYATLARAGGESRVRMLLKIAQFDEHKARLSDEEAERYEMVGQTLVDLSVQTLQNFSVVGSLLFSATFLSVIGRPTPWTPSPETVERMGVDGSTALMYAAFILASCISTATLVALLYSVGSRYMLTYVLGSLESRLCLLCELNPVGVVSRLFIAGVMSCHRP